MTEATDAQKKCQHRQFHATVAVNRMEDTGRFMADITIACLECHLPFEFVGLQAGIAWDRPTCSITGDELHAPIEPQYLTQLRPSASFAMPPELAQPKH